MLARTSDQAPAQPVPAAAIVIAIVGLMTMAGFFTFQYVLGYPPCPLCLEQRYAFYVSVPLAAMMSTSPLVWCSQPRSSVTFLKVARKASVR